MLKCLLVAITLEKERTNQIIIKKRIKLGGVTNLDLETRIRKCPLIDK